MEDALEAIENHPFMILKKEDFATMRINWQDKASNIKEIAKELNIGLDSMIFMDDSPVEREWVEKSLPEVLVVDMPSDPSYYVDTLYSIAELHRLYISEEDKKRTEMYASQKKRDELKDSSSNILDFYESLNMEAIIKDIDDFSFNRVVQLINKTNQFNLTTRRYSEAEISKMQNNREYRIFTLELTDKFGDNGIVGVMIIKLNTEYAVIDTFILSCRVMGRTVETALLAVIAEIVKENDVNILQGEYLPTAKNKPVIDLYSNHGFKDIHNDNHLWEIDLSKNDIKAPKYIKIKMLCTKIK